jgi:flagella basal body P-ring formation protein FlgA
MTAFTILALALSVATGSPGQSAVDSLRSAIRASVAERIGDVRSVDVELAGGSMVTGEIVSAQPAAGARLGGSIRFLVKPATGRVYQVVARVRVIAGRAVATRAIPRGQRVTAADVDWSEGSLDGQLLQPLPSLDAVLASQTRRAIAPGEVLTSIVLAEPVAVRAGEEVALTVRAGAMEVRGVARAVSSGSVGDVIRVTTPGSRDIRRARIVAPAKVEIVR